MAEFGIQATQLQDPQMRGSAPISPVQDPASVVPNLGGLGNLISGLVNKQAKPYNNMVSDYVKQASDIQQLRLTGEYSATTAANRLAMLTVQFQKNGADFGPEYTKAIADANTHMRVGTRMGRNDEQLNSQEDANQKNFQDLQTQGFFSTAGSWADMSPQEQSTITQFSTAAQNAKYVSEQQYKAWQQRNEIEKEGRAAGTWQREADDYIMKKQTQDALGGLMSSSIGLADAQLTHVMGATGMTDEQRRLTFNNSISRMKAEAFNLLKGSPDTYGVYSSYLDNLTKLGAEMLDPNKRTQALEDEWKRTITQGKLNFVNADPANLRAAAVSSVVPNNAAGILAIDSAAMNYLKPDLLSADRGAPLESVVTGNTKGQQVTFKAASDTTRRVMNNQSLNPQKELADASKVYDSTVKAITTFQPGSQNSMAHSVDALASQEYGYLVKQKMFDAGTNIQAAQRMGDLYLPAVATEVRNTLSAPIGDTRYEDGKPSKNNATLINLIDFKVDDNGKITIIKNIPKDSEFRKGITASDVYIDSMIRKANDTLGKDLTNSIRAGAHLEGRTDYKVFFNEMAPALLRGFMPPQQMLEQLKSQGYSGTGNVNNPANWRGNSGFPSERQNTSN